MTDRFHVAKKFNEAVDTLRKKLTRDYKAKLSKAERKAFRSQMWAFRRDPASLTPEEQRALEGLFEKIPKLKDLYRVRLHFKDIFDTARDRTTAARWLSACGERPKTWGWTSAGSSRPMTNEAVPQTDEM